MRVVMALVDYIPVILFLCSAILLQRGLYHMMSKGAYAVFSSGTIMVVVAGIYKASWKLLYCLGICNFESLSKCFFPMQSTGFFLAAMGLIALRTNPGQSKSEKVMSAAAVPAVYSGTMIFVGMMVAGIGVLCGTMCYFAKKLGKKYLYAVFAAAFAAMLGMGYLSTKDFSGAFMNWLAELLNILGQGMLLFGIVRLNRSGLAAYTFQEQGDNV